MPPFTSVLKKLSAETGSATPEIFNPKAVSDNPEIFAVTPSNVSVLTFNPGNSLVNPARTGFGTNESFDITDMA